ncbi:FAD-dependent oxidoreductase [Ottowia thiooxydans]|uniref:FAD-dependent oxidoreductase n=1 Tax=Ottowia thiooxydans TaxID=219182 RepID=A0ABV2Q2X2_9BURK
MVMQTILEPQRSIEVASEVDVVVVGGGPSGVCAAIGAARSGARVALIERMGFLGGSATSAMVASLVGYYRGTEELVTGGVGYDIVRRVMEAGGSRGFWLQMHGASTGTPIPLYSFPFEPEIMKKVLDDMVCEAGIDLWLHTQASDPLIVDGKLAGVIVQGRYDRKAILAKTVVEAGADGLMARKLGCKVENADQDPRSRQPMSLMMRIGGADGMIYRALPGPEKQAIVRRGFEAGILPSKLLAMISAPNEGDAFILTTRIPGWDGADERDLTQAELAGRAQVFPIVDFLRKEVPGFEKCYLASLAPTIGIRETWRIVGDYVLEKEDVMVGRQFPDNIAQGGGPLDIHHTSGGGLTLYHPEAPFAIPYRCLLPLGVEGLLITGRCASATEDAMGALRSMPPCMAIGHAAGVAASLAAQAGLSPRQLDVADVQRELKKQGAVIDQPRGIATVEYMAPGQRPYQPAPAQPAAGAGAAPMPSPVAGA